MNKRFLALLLLCFSGLAQAQTAQPVIELQTNLGNMTLELNAAKAPITVKNFLQYAENGWYNGTIFHRVLPNYMAQGGRYNPKYQKREAPHPPIQNEADSGLKNRMGTIAMVRGKDPHTAQDQFFINLNDNTTLDYTSSTPAGWGYAVFGRITDGMEVLDAIQGVPTGAGGPFKQNLPQQPIVIKKIVVLQGAAADIALPDENTEALIALEADDTETTDDAPDLETQPADSTSAPADIERAELVTEDIAPEEEDTSITADVVVDTAVADSPELEDFAPEPPDVPAVQ